MITKNSVVKTQSPFMNHESWPIKANSGSMYVLCFSWQENYEHCLFKNKEQIRSNTVHKDARQKKYIKIHKLAS